MKNLMKKKQLKWSVSLILILSMTAGLVSFNNDQRNFEIVKNLDIFYTLFRELNSYYVDEIDPGKLIKTGIDDMLESLDPYTTYIPESELEDFKFMTTGEYAGIGAVITKLGDYVAISEPYEGFPAQKAGLKAGDKIIQIDGKDVKGKTTKQVSEMLKGPANTKVELKIERPGVKKPLNIEITREKIQINPVPWYGMVDNETGYIVLNNFTQGCSRNVKDAFTDLRDKQGAKKIIFDLRGNPGGLLDEAVKIANLFLPSGTEVVSTRGKVKQWDKVYKANRQPVDTVMPLVVLVSRGSASASEIVSGALQDMDRAVLIGQRTFGKGLVQTTRNLAYNAKLKVTTAKYYIPSGRCIQAVDYSHRNEDGSVGLVPDSLIREFKTKNGRPVYDGGGISPDIKVKQKKYGNITYALVMQQMFFNYATDFTLKHPSIPPVNDFTVTDDIFNDFKQYVLAQKDFKYESKTQEMFDEMKETAQKEGYYDAAKEQFGELQKMLKLDVNKDLDMFSDEIKELLGIEIVKRYYYQKGAIQFGLKDDPELEEAKKLFSDMNEYYGLLNGTIPSHAGDRRSMKN
ncbi:MAG: S41 family peptidase [Chlorobi bacterium]|nr:S41 family peptidase [Chlorobiota bacterium]